MSRKCTCYCQLCACKEFAKVLAEKCVLKCPACQREADRIIVKNAADDERVPVLRRCRSADTIREKLEDEIFDMHRSVVPAQREPSSQTIAKGGLNTRRQLAMRKYNETISAIGKLKKEIFVLRKQEVPSQQAPPSQMVTETGQNRQRSLTLRRYMEALSASKELIYAILDYCGDEVQLQQEPSSQAVEEGKQNAQTFSVMRLCEEAMSTLEEMAEALLGNCDAEIISHHESTSQTVAEGKQNTQNGGLPKGTYEKTEAAFDKLFDVICNFIAVEIPIQQTSFNQNVVEDKWSPRQVPLLHRCESATFTWDKQCPICQTTPDIDHESRCVSSHRTNRVTL